MRRGNWRRGSGVRRFGQREGGRATWERLSFGWIESVWWREALVYFVYVRRLTPYAFLK